jgi:hypothetical protein
MAAEPLTPEETAAADLLYDELKPMAVASARDYVLARTPARYQEYMTTKIEADWPAPPVALSMAQYEQGRVSVQQPAVQPGNQPPAQPAGAVYGPQQPAA